MKPITACIFCIGFAAAVLAWDRPNPAAISGYDPVLEQNDVRVTLLQISAATTFTNQYVEQAPIAGVHPTPGIELQYLVEFIGEGPLPQFTNGGVKLYQNNELITPEPNITPGGVSSSQAYSGQYGSGRLALTAPADPKHLKIREEYLRGVRIDGGSVQIRITVGFGELQTFVFDDVPVVGLGQ